MHSRVRRLIVSNLLEAVAAPIGSVGNLFITAFIFRATDSLIPVALYSIGSFISLPLAFWLVGYLLRRWDIRKSFLLGAICNGLVIVSVVFFKGDGPSAFLLYGCIWGLGLGMYYANRNYLELQETDESIRQNYFGILYSFAQVASIVVPFIAGWFIILAPRLGLLSFAHSYWVLFIFAFVFMGASGLVIAGGDYIVVPPESITRFMRGSLFTERRLLNMAGGTIDGIGFLSPLIVLTFLGNEGILGTIATIVSIVAAITMYMYGRLFKGHYRYSIMIGTSCVFLLCAAVFAFGPHVAGAILYSILGSIASGFYFLTVSPVLLELCDREMRGDIGDRYSLVFDGEFFLNLGRVIAVLFVLLIAYVVSPLAALLGGAFFGGLTQLLLLSYLRLRPVPTVSTFAERTDAKH